MGVYPCLSILNVNVAAAIYLLPFVAWVVVKSDTRCFEFVYLRSTLQVLEYCHEEPIKSKISH